MVASYCSVYILFPGDRLAEQFVSFIFSYTLYFAFTYEFLNYFYSCRSSLTLGLGAVVDDLNAYKFSSNDTHSTIGFSFLRDVTYVFI